MNCQIKKLIISISSLGSTLSGDHIAVHVYASNEAEKLLVGRLDFLGKTDAGFKRSLNVICPDGFTLTAVVVDGYGIPHPFSDNWGVTVADDLYFPLGGQYPAEQDMNKQLSGAAGDVLHALFFRGALVDGDLPSKSGAAELRELGYVKTQDTATAFSGENHYNFLTAAGQEFAISHLVDSRFGKQSPMEIKDAQVFINDALITYDIAATTVKTWEQTVEDRLNEQSANLASLSTLQASIGEVVSATIEKELQPGGLLYARK